MALWGGARYQIGQLIETLKSEGRFQEIQPAVTALKKEHKISIPKDLASFSRIISMICALCSASLC